MSAVPSDYGVLIVNIVFYIEFTPSVVILWNIMHSRVQQSTAQPSAGARKDTTCGKIQVITKKITKKLQVMISSMPITFLHPQESASAIHFQVLHPPALAISSQLYRQKPPMAHPDRKSVV